MVRFLFVVVVLFLITGKLIPSEDHRMSKQESQGSTFLWYFLAVNSLKAYSLLLYFSSKLHVFALGLSDLSGTRNSISRFLAPFLKCFLNCRGCLAASKLQTEIFFHQGLFKENYSSPYL